MAYFSDELHQEFCGLATAWAMVGAADLGEIEAIAKAFPDDGDDDAYYEAWASAAERHLALADAAERAGRQQTALGHLWRTVSCYGVAIHVVYGTPVDPRMTKGFDSLTAAFERALAIEVPAAETFSAPFDGYELPGWFVPAFGSRPGEVRPLLVLTNGYDATMADLYLGIGRTAAERGYHVVIFDGPGQGSPLVHHGLPMIPEWERVVTAVVDAVIGRADVDASRIGLYGWSLGGLLAPRAATGEHRLAAVVADPALWGVLDGMRSLMTAIGSSEMADHLPDIPDDVAARLTEFIVGNRTLEWKIVKRGYWVNGADDIQSFARVAAGFTLDGRAQDITCPVLGTQAEHDPLSGGAGAMLGQMGGPTTLLRFSASEGAGEHCEMQNRWLLTTKVLDWLDGILQ